MEKVKQSLLLKEGAKISSCVSVEVQSADGELRLVDLIREDGTLYGICWFEVGKESKFDNVDYLYEAFLDFEAKRKNTKAYKDLKEYIEDNATKFTFKEYKQELKVMFRDAVKLGMFSSVKGC